METLGSSPGLGVVLLSAPSPEELKQQVEALSVELTEGADFEGTCSLLAHREHQPYRLAFAANGHGEAKDKLLRFLDHGSSPLTDFGSEPSVFEGHVQGSPRPVALLVADIGAEWYECDWLSGAALDTACTALLAAGLPDPRPLFSLPRLEVEGKISCAESHAALFAFEVALLDLLQRLGLSFSSVGSFSMGEPAGAVACGALSLQQGAIVMAAMTKCIGSIEGQGGMLAVIGLSEEELQSEAQAAGLEVGAHFAERGGALTGSLSGIIKAEERLTGDSRVHFMKRPEVIRAAYHSEQLLATEPTLRAELSALEPEVQQGAPTRVWYNSITGALESDPKTAVGDPAFWFKGLRDMARSYPAMSAIVRDGFSLLVELNTRPLYARTAADIGLSLGSLATGQDVVAVPALHKDWCLSVQEQLLTVLCRLHCAGAAVNWQAIYP